MSHAEPISPWIVGGVALATAGAIAATPVTPTPPHLQLAPLPAVTLTAGETVNVDGWTALFDNTGHNITGLFDHAGGAPFPLLQQLLVNQVDHAKDLFTGNFQGIFTDIGDNFKDAGNALVNPFLPGGPLPDHIYPSLDGTPGSAEITGTLLPGGQGLLPETELSPTGLPFPSHEELFQLLQDKSWMLTDLLNGTPLESLTGTILGLLAFSASPLSGVLWGQLGLVASPIVQSALELQDLGRDLGNIGSDPAAVFNDLINAPANILNAFLNGTTMDVSLLDDGTFAAVLVPAIQQVLPTIIDQYIPGLNELPGVSEIITGTVGEVTKYLSVDVHTPITFGGLLSPGGSMFDALGLHADVDLTSPLLGIGGGLDLPGVAVGPIGSLIELGQALASAIGWDDLGVNPLDSLGDIFAGL